MNIQLATHQGMCFGVRDALRLTHRAAQQGPLTILGQLVHNPAVSSHFKQLGVQEGNLDQPGSAATDHVVITAHGAADRHRQAWKSAGYTVTDTTCPLVRKAHDALGDLVKQGYFPVIIGQPAHVEVQGLRGDFPDAFVIHAVEDIHRLPQHSHYGIISQTTQPLTRVLELVEDLKALRPESAVRFVDTVCRPTKQRQQALDELCERCDVIVVIGGRTSNNTRQLAETARRKGCRAHQVEGPQDLDSSWFKSSDEVGVTAGTSTLDETVRAVLDALQCMSAQQKSWFSV